MSVSEASAVGIDDDDDDDDDDTSSAAFSSEDTAVSSSKSTDSPVPPSVCGPHASLADSSRILRRSSSVSPAPEGWAISEVPTVLVSLFDVVLDDGGASRVAGNSPLAILPISASSSRPISSFRVSCSSELTCARRQWQRRRRDEVFFWIQRDNRVRFHAARWREACNHGAVYEKRISHGTWIRTSLNSDIAGWKERTARAALRTTSASPFGPNTISATTPTMTASGAPTPRIERHATSR